MIITDLQYRYKVEVEVELESLVREKEYRRGGLEL
jgi:hypothetical protein